VRVAVTALVLVTAALLQTTLFPHLTLAGFRPDLLLLVVATFALRDGPLVGLRVGFAAGLLADLLLHQSAVGLEALVLLGTGYIVGVARPYLAPESVSAPLVVAFTSGFAATAGYGILARLLGDERFTTDLVVQASVFVALYNTLLTPPVMAGVRWLTTRFPTERAVRI
jgi:rod shape-determining protein MreD